MIHPSRPRAHTSWTRPRPSRTRSQPSSPTAPIPSRARPRRRNLLSSRRRASFILQHIPRNFERILIPRSFLIPTPPTGRLIGITGYRPPRFRRQTRLLRLPGPQHTRTQHVPATMDTSMSRSATTSQTLAWASQRTTWLSSSRARSLHHRSNSHGSLSQIKVAGHTLRASARAHRRSATARAIHCLKSAAPRYARRRVLIRLGLPWMSETNSG